MVNRSKKMSASSDFPDQFGSSSDCEDSTFVPEVRNVAGRKRRRAAKDHTESDSDSEETIAVPRRGRRRSGQGRIDSEEPEAEDTTDAPGRTRERSVQDDTDSDDSGEGRTHLGRRGRRRKTKTRKNGKVIEAVWTAEKTVRITYDIGVKHACMNPIHGKQSATYKVLHLVKCSWRNNVKMMKVIPSAERSKRFQYCHKLCEPCLNRYGSHCFKCEPVQGEVTPILNTVFGSDAITNVEDFRDSVKRWQGLREEARASYLVLHCTVIGPEASLLRRRFSIKRSTVMHIVYSDVRDKMEPAGSGTNLEDSMFQHVWKTVMKEKVPCQEFSLVSFFGNILLNDSLSFNDFRVNDLLLMYEPSIFNGLEEDALRVNINSLYMQSVPYVQASPSECCLRDAVEHRHREPTSQEDDCTFQHGSLVASLFFQGIKRYFGSKIISECEQRAELGEALRIGDEGQKLPFRKLYAARGGEVRFRRVGNTSHDFPRGDARSRICGWDTSGFEFVCWAQRGNPVGGDFVIPGLMYRLKTSPGSSLIFRPTRYYHATLPIQNRDLMNEKFAAAFVTPT